MTDEMREVIDATVNQTVLKLKMAGLMKDDGKSAYDKTDALLKNYNAFKQSDQPYTVKLLKQIDEAIESLNDDPYIDLIDMYYRHGWTLEEIAEELDVSVRTVTRNKVRLLNKLKLILFSDRVIEEMFLS